MSKRDEAEAAHWVEEPPIQREETVVILRDGKVSLIKTPNF